jgi:hypothetical protein
MEQETAVDYIFRKLDVLCRLTPQTRVTGTSEEWQNLYEKSKEKEREQMHKCASFWRGKENEIEKAMFDEYYKETYNK